MQSYCTVQEIKNKNENFFEVAWSQNSEILKSVHHDSQKNHRLEIFLTRNKGEIQACEELQSTLTFRGSHFYQVTNILRTKKNPTPHIIFRLTMKLLYYGHTEMQGFPRSAALQVQALCHDCCTASGSRPSPPPPSTLYMYQVWCAQLHLHPCDMTKRNHG